MTGLSVRAVVAERKLDVDFSVAPGEVLAVLGPNGAGKSTAMHVIAGLVQPDSGVVRLGGRVLTDTAAAVRVPTYDRRVGLLLQDPLLFPHMTVAANVAFPLRSRHRLSSARTRRRCAAAALHWLGEVDAAELADRMPRQLSGGQAQRVALARALAAEPDVLLLDEPMAGLDVTAATAVRAVLRRVLAPGSRSAVLITHDLLDVLTLADRVLVIESGRVAEAGTATAVLAAPRSRFGASFAGVNLVLGTAGSDGTLVTEWGTTWCGLWAPEVRPGGPAVAIFRPAAVAVYTDKPDGSPRNMVEAVVAELDARGTALRVRSETQPDGTAGLAADITAAAAADLRLTPGDRIHFVVKAQEVAIHPAP